MQQCALDQVPSGGEVFSGVTSSPRCLHSVKDQFHHS